MYKCELIHSQNVNTKMKHSILKTFLLFPLLPLIRGQTAANASCCDSPDCLRGRVQHVLADLSNGIQIDGMEVTINPLQHPGPFVYHGNIPKFDFTGVTTNNVFRGLADSEVTDARVSDMRSNVTLSFRTAIPLLVHVANYTLVGSIGPLEGYGDDRIPLNESGPAYFTYGNAEFRNEIILDRENQNGESILRLRSYRAKLSVESSSSNLENLFGGGDIPKAKAALSFINDSLPDIITQIEPELNRAYSEAFADVFRQLLNRPHIEELLCLGRQ